LAEIGYQLQQPGVRLLTLVGPGGMGKTRLAVEVGRTHLALYPDGVCFVPLAPISTTVALVDAIVTALGIAPSGNEPRTLLLQTLRPKQLLLILDNLEHLLAQGRDTIDLVVDFLRTAPGVQILATSRERLNLRNEVLYPLQPLNFSLNATLAEAQAAAAVRLFVQAAQRVHADFQLTAANLAAVLRICRLVQGMPLGLELAAANVYGAPLMAIADAIEQSTEVLSADWRDVPARQRSMRGVFEWSWRLLSAAEQRILCQCARFRGGFDYAAAQAVSGATPALLLALVDKSLLQWQATTPGEGRYTMHELLRQFAAEALVESGAGAVVEERHGRYYLAYLAARGFRLGRSEPKEASAEIQVELENIRLAWHWAATQGGLAELDQALYAWWQFCLLQGLEREARQSLAAALAGVRAQLMRLTDDAALHLLGTRLLAKLLALHADYLFAQGQDEEMAAQRRRCGNRPCNSSGATSSNSQRTSCCAKSNGWRTLCCAAVHSTLAIMPVTAPILWRRYASAKRWANSVANSPVCRAWGRAIFSFTTLRRPRRTIGRSWRWGAAWGIVSRKCRRRRGWRGSPGYVVITQRRSPCWNRASAPPPN
jgi:predicted ATPase